MLCPRPRNTWRPYAPTGSGYALVVLKDGRELRVMRASHKASVELSLAEAYWEVLECRKGTNAWTPEIIHLEDIKDDPAVRKVNKARAKLESAEARKRGRV